MIMDFSETKYLNRQADRTRREKIRNALLVFGATAVIVAAVWAWRGL